ncbi:uncharacterized protein V6R79_004611 [Siganus canaliculatus]
MFLVFCLPVFAVKSVIWRDGAVAKELSTHNIQELRRQKERERERGGSLQLHQSALSAAQVWSDERLEDTDRERQGGGEGDEAEDRAASSSLSSVTVGADRWVRRCRASSTGCAPVLPEEAHILRMTLEDQAVRLNRVILGRGKLIEHQPLFNHSAVKNKERKAKHTWFINLH